MHKQRGVKREAPSAQKQTTNSNKNVTQSNKPSSHSTFSPSKPQKTNSKSASQQQPQQGAKGSAIWLWQDDHDKWLKYDSTTSEALERAFEAGSSEGRVDDERYVDFDSMLQRRFDNQNKRRYVKRQVVLTDTQKANIEKNKQEALKKLTAKGLSSQPKLSSFWNKSASQPVGDKSKSGSFVSRYSSQDVVSSKAIQMDDDEDDDDDNAPSTHTPSGSSDRGFLLEPIELQDSDDDDEEDQTDVKSKLEKKRALYACGTEYTTLSQVNSWDISLLRLKAESDPSAPYHNNPNNEKYNKIISLWQGDITSLEIGAIVNAAKPSLLGGGGIDGAIHQAAGKGLVKECMVVHSDGCEVGEARLTGGHRLPAEYVIHTVGPVGEAPLKLRSCYLSSLDLLRGANIREVAFCCVSTGIYGYPNKKAAHVALKTVRDWLDKNGTSGIDRIVFCVFLEKDFNIYSNLMPVYFPPDDN